MKNKCFVLATGKYWNIEMRVSEDGAIRARGSFQIRDKEKILRYQRTEKGKNAHMQRVRKYRNTEKGKLRKREEYAKRKGLGYNPLNTPFVGCEPHHIDREHVIYIPKEMHWSVWHKLDTLEGMVKINAMAWDYLFREVGGLICVLGTLEQASMN